MAADADPDHERSPFRLAGWAWSEAYRRTLGAYPCGCNALAEPGIDEQDEHEARARQSEWRCPCAGHKPAASAEDLPEGARETLADIERLTKATGLRTCPNAYLRIDWAVRLVALHSHREKHTLQYARSRLSAAEMAALSILDAAIAEREAHDIREARKPPQTSSHD